MGLTVELGVEKQIIVLPVSKCYRQQYSGENWRESGKRHSANLFILNRNNPPFILENAAIHQKGKATSIVYEKKLIIVP